MSPRWAAIGGGACGAALGSGTVAGGEWRKYLRFSGNSYFPNGDCSCRAPAACVMWRCRVGFRRCCSRHRSRPSVLLPIFASVTCICATRLDSRAADATPAVTPARRTNPAPRLAACRRRRRHPILHRRRAPIQPDSWKCAASSRRFISKMTTLSQNYAQANANVQQATDKIAAADPAEQPAPDRSLTTRLRARRRYKKRVTKPSVAPRRASRR